MALGSPGGALLVFPMGLMSLPSGGLGYLVQPHWVSHPHWGIFAQTLKVGLRCPEGTAERSLTKGYRLSVTLGGGSFLQHTPWKYREITQLPWVLVFLIWEVGMMGSFRVPKEDAQEGFGIPSKALVGAGFWGCKVGEGWLGVKSLSWSPPDSAYKAERQKHLHFSVDLPCPAHTGRAIIRYGSLMFGDVSGGIRCS